LAMMVILLPVLLSSDDCHRLATILNRKRTKVKGNDKVYHGTAGAAVM